MFHLFDCAHLFGVLLADMLINRQHTLSNKCLRHHRHITEIIWNEEHSYNGALWVEKCGLNLSGPWD